LRDATGICWVCSSCGGRAVSVSLLRRTVSHELVKEIWRLAMTDPSVSNYACPHCRRQMDRVTLELDRRPLELDLCRRCEFVWFDRGEYEALPPPEPKPRALGDIDLKSLPLELREKIAMAKVKEIADRARVEDPEPDEGWKNVPAVLGLPVEMESQPALRFPWATWVLSGLIAAISITAFFHLRAAVIDYGLIPDMAWRRHGLTFVSAFFLHAGVVHLLGNLYFLIVFGRPVENFIGPWRWLALIASAAFVGDLLHVKFDPHGTIPCVGASGGISGLLIFYALKFPYAKIGLMLRYAIIRYGWIQLPAWTAFLLWAVLQGWGAYQQITGSSNVSALAHLGGVAVGFIGWLAWRNLDAVRAPTSPLIKVIG
jgi:membrane associated rhomboid family serine protease